MGLYCPGLSCIKLPFHNVLRAFCLMHQSYRSALATCWGYPVAWVHATGLFVAKSWYQTINFTASDYIRGHLFRGPGSTECSNGICRDYHCYSGCPRCPLKVGNSRLRSHHATWFQKLYLGCCNGAALTSARAHVS
jgi:hypothetical protein